jgi:hypothetical protein
MVFAGNTHAQRLMRIAHIYESSGDVIGALFMYREVILTQDAIAAPLAIERVAALARNANPGEGRRDGCDQSSRSLSPGSQT